MAEKKKQHYVPKVYMCRFANEDKQFAVYNIKNKESFHPIPYDSQCYKDYYYGKDLIWENRLGEMESAWGAAFTLVVNQRTLSEENIKLLKQFALYQRQRTLAEGEFSKRERQEVLIEYGKSICANRGLPFNDIAREICIERANESIAPAETLQHAVECFDLIADLDVTIFNYQTTRKLISSDVPVIAINPFHQHTIGYGCMGLILLFPISSSQLVVIYDGKMYPKFKGKQYVNMSNETEVHNLNVLQLISADKILFAYDKKDFPSFTHFEWDAREKNRNYSSVTALGNNKQKLIVTSLRKTIWIHNFTFGKIRSDFSIIPFQCREAAQRKWEQGWEDKLKNAASIIPQISKFNSEFLKNSGMTKKQLQRGYDAMAKAAQKYWEK